MQRDKIMHATNPLIEVKRFGQSLWLDNLSRTLLREGGLKQLIEEDGISGVTSNPAIFQKPSPKAPTTKTKSHNSNKLI